MKSKLVLVCLALLVGGADAYAQEAPPPAPVPEPAVQPQPEPAVPAAPPEPVAPAPLGQPEPAPAVPVAEPAPLGQPEPVPPPEAAPAPVPAQPEPAPAAPVAQPEPTPQPGGEDVIPEAYWRKAMQWIGQDEEPAGKLLLRDLTREYPESPFGSKARDWLDVHQDLDQSGRVDLIASATLLGSWLGFSFAIGYSHESCEREYDYESCSDEPDMETVVWSAVGGGLGALTAAALGSSGQTVTDAQANFFYSFGLWGWENGFVLYDLLYTLDWRDAFVAGATGMSIGLATSLALWKDLDTEEGASYMATYTSFYAFEEILWLNFAVGGKHVFRDSEKTALLMLLLPSNAAAVGGYFLGKNLRWTADDVQLIFLGGILGNLVGGAINVSAQPDDISDAAMTMALAVAAGIGTGIAVVQPWKHAGMDSKRQGKLGGGLLDFSTGRLTLQTPLPAVIPAQYRGETGYQVELPLVSMGW